MGEKKVKVINYQDLWRRIVCPVLNIFLNEYGAISN